MIFDQDPTYIKIKDILYNLDKINLKTKMDLYNELYLRMAFTKDHKKMFVLMRDDLVDTAFELYKNDCEKYNKSIKFLSSIFQYLDKFFKAFAPYMHDNYDFKYTDTLTYSNLRILV